MDEIARKQNASVSAPFELSKILVVIAMALKFLNKKGWHTGSLRNIENVWKAEQKHEGEQKKLEELRKQIQEERERSEFRLLQEQAGLVPKQERLDFLYDSGLAVGKTSEGFKALEAVPKPDNEAASSSSAKASVPGALFEEKPQSANDAWRKLHSDPLLMIKQREQEALARVKNNPVQMAMIRQSVEGKKQKEKTSDSKKRKKHRDKDSSKHKRHHSSDSDNEDKERRTSEYDDNKHYKKPQEDSEDESRVRVSRRYSTNDDGKKRNYDGERRSSKYDDNKHSKKGHHSSDADKDDKEGRSSKYDGHRHSKKLQQDSEDESRERVSRRYPTNDDGNKRNYDEERRSSKYDDNKHSDKGHQSSDSVKDDKQRRSPKYDENKHYKRPPQGSEDESRERVSRINSNYKQSETAIDDDRNNKRNSYEQEDRSRTGSSYHKPRYNVPKLTEEERAAKLREMQEDAELHEEQRWKRLKKAEDDDKKEAIQASVTSGKNFLDGARKSVYGAEKGGSATIEESVRRRRHYRQDRSEADAGNAFRR